MTSQGYNLESGTDCGFNMQGKPGDQWNTDPNLGPLADNGGPTWTHALPEDSPAVDHIPYATNGCGTDYITDQRGYGRPSPAAGSCDVGAYEQAAVTSTIACDVAELIDVINIAKGNGQPDIINLAAGCTYTLTAVDNVTDGPNGLPSITSRITINGNGATIERSSGMGTPAFRIFHVASDGNLALTNITIVNGDAGSLDHGGAIYNAGALSISNSTVCGNTASKEAGGGILNNGTLNISDSTLSGNTAFYGGGIYNQSGLAVMTMSNSTLSDNTTTTYGGGILNNGTVNISHSTLSGNTAGIDGGGILNNVGAVVVKNTIVAGNTSNNCFGTMTSQGYNLESGIECNFTQPGDLQGATANLDPLQNNGGPTWTHALLTGSPAIDRIPYATNGCGTTYTTDQRGADRANGSGHGGDQCDIGAYEYDSAPCPLVGDVDNNGHVDIADVMLVAGSWHCQSGEGCYDERYDLDKDSDIDIVDIMLVVAHWGDTC
jgi:hypothetical protein